MRFIKMTEGSELGRSRMGKSIIELAFLLLDLAEEPVKSLKLATSPCRPVMPVSISFTVSSNFSWRRPVT
jgi:hypothetical protein